MEDCLLYPWTLHYFAIMSVCFSIVSYWDGMLVFGLPVKILWKTCVGELNFVFQGKYVTSRNLRDRLYRELERNLAMKVEDGETSDIFIVSGRGTLHITILIENM